MAPHEERFQALCGRYQHNPYSLASHEEGCLGCRLVKAERRVADLELALDTAENKVERYSITARDSYERIAKTHNENITLRAERDALRLALTPLVKTLAVGYLNNLVQLCIDGVPVYRPIEPNMRERLEALSHLLLNASDVLTGEAPQAQEGEC